MQAAARLPPGSQDLVHSQRWAPWHWCYTCFTYPRGFQLAKRREGNQWLGSPPSPGLQLKAGAEGQGRRQVLMNCSVFHPGAQAEVSADQVATVIWDYFSQLSNNAKKAVEHLQQSELTQQLK